MGKLLSLCVPTYGVSEWVFPVLDSIYNQKADEELFEVVVTDNGNNSEFEKEIIEYSKKHTNLVYKKTNAYSFLNEIESYKVASGEFIKFINHRALMVENSINYLLEFIRHNINDKPIVYFSTGVLKLKDKVLISSSFDSFVHNMSYWSSCSTGMAIWKEDFDKIKNYPIDKFNELFPHTTILFNEKNRAKYIVDDTKIIEEIPSDASKKGKYDLFYAFCVEYPSIILDLYRKNVISFDTFNYVKNLNLEFISKLYYLYVKRGQPCSYKLDSFDKSIKVFYSKTVVKKCIRKIIIKKIFYRKK